MVKKKGKKPAKRVAKKTTRKVKKVTNLVMKKTVKKRIVKKAKPKAKPSAKQITNSDFDVIEVPHEYADELIKLNRLLRSHRDKDREKHIERVEKKLQNALDEIGNMEKEHAAKEEGYPYVKIKIEPRVIKPYHRKARPPTAYNEFVKTRIEAGATFSQAVKMWKAHKEIEENKKRGLIGRLFKKKPKKIKEKTKIKPPVKKGPMSYLEMAKRSISAGEVDISLISKAIIEVLEAKKKVKIDYLSKELGIKPGRILEVVAVIETHDIRVKYPLVGKPKLVLVSKKK